MMRFMSQVPAGWLASRLGAKWVLGGGMFISGIFTLLLPIAAEVLPLVSCCRERVSVSISALAIH